MIQVTIRQLVHGLTGYLTAARKGERVVILRRRAPVADLVPHNDDLDQPGWKRKISKIKVKGGSFSGTVRKMRDEKR